MAKLVLSVDGLILKEVLLNKERTAIGRKLNNDIQLENLAVSGEHAVVVTLMGESFIEDLGSTNGIRVNGRPVKKHFLQENDLIEVGKYCLQYVAAHTASDDASQPIEKTVVLRPPVRKDFAILGPATLPLDGLSLDASAALPGAGTAEAGTFPAAPASGAPRAPAGARAASPLGTAGSGADRPSGGKGLFASLPGTGSRQAESAQPEAILAAGLETAPESARPGAAGHGRRACIQVLSGVHAGRELALEKPLTTLGRAKSEVAVIARRPQGYFLAHVEGRSYPIVNGKDLGPEGHRLADHDIIELAGVRMEFSFRD
jgi:FHA domain